MDTLSRPCRATLPCRAGEGKAGGGGKFHGTVLAGRYDEETGIGRGRGYLDFVSNWLLLVKMMVRVIES
jgi:hypothetical protein